VITTGGIYGTIVAVREKDDTVQLENRPVRSRFEAERSAIARLADVGEGKSKPASEGRYHRMQSKIRKTESSLILIVTLVCRGSP